MVPTGLIGAVKPNTKAFKQNNLKSAQLFSCAAQRAFREGNKTKQNKTKQKKTGVKSTD